MDNVVMLLSGGLDSATLLHHVCRVRPESRLFALSLSYGQTHARELEMARWQARQAGVLRHEVVDLEVYGRLVSGGTVLTGTAANIPDLEDLAPAQRDQPPTYVPHRNMLFLTLGAGYAEAVGARDVFYGAQAQDRYGYWDCTTGFVERMNAVFALNRGRTVTVHAPFAEKTKAEIVKMGLALGVDYSHTWTCYRGGRRACALCPSCVERAAAFEAAGVCDPLTQRA